MFLGKKKDCYKGIYFKGNFYTKNPEGESHKEVTIYVKPNFIQKEQTSVQS